MTSLMPRTVIAVTGLLFVAGCSSDCSNTPVTSSEAPDGLHTAIIFLRECGATTDFSTQISVLMAGQEPAGAGNAFIADADHGAAATGGWGGPWAEIVWVESDHLMVRYAANTRIFEQKNRVSSVKISYEQANR